MKKLITCILILAVTRIFAQIPVPPITVPSSNAASLGLFGEYPVSYYTGLPNIEIPLYTIKEREIAVPISLSYHASGVRPDQHPGWVGNGWSLNAGGVITRKVNDNSDEYDNQQSGVAASKRAGFYFTHSLIDNDNWNTANGMAEILSDLEKYNRDTEPDEFSFNFQGYNGKFYLGANGQWKVKCDKPIKVSLLYVTVNNELSEFLPIPFNAPNGTSFYLSAYPKSFAGFIITGEDGTQYVFGGNSDAIEYSIPFYSQNTNPWTATSWYLTKIITKNSFETVNFVYQKDSFINQMYISIYNKIENTSNNPGGLFGWVSGYCSEHSFTTVPASFYGQLIAPVYLKEINTASIKVSFKRSSTSELRYNPNTDYETRYKINLPPGQVICPIMAIDHSTTGPELIEVSSKGSFQTNGNYNPGDPTNPHPADFLESLNFLQWKQLDNIEITDKGKMIRGFKFKYTTDTKVRLTLEELYEYDLNYQDKPPYVFSYYDQSLLPPYLSNKVDHWGFYNGTYANIGTWDYLSTYYQERQPTNNLNFVQAGTLRKITYPTGGATEFYYELNKYRKQVKQLRSEGFESLSSDQIAGGLRISKIISYPVDDPLKKIQKEYLYVSGYSGQTSPAALPSSGILEGQIKYNFSDYIARDINNSSLLYSSSSFSSQSVLPVTNNSSGSHIGYSEVVEKRSDGSYSRFLFSNYDDPAFYDEATPTINVSHTPYVPVTSKDSERGKLLLSEIYNSGNKLMKSEKYKYTALNKANEFVKSVKVRAFGSCSSILVNAVEGTAYKFYVYSFLPSEITTTLYDVQGLNPVTTIQNNYYDNPLHRQLTRSEVKNSNGKTVKTFSIYPQDYDFNTNAGFVKKMVENNNIGTPIETVISKSSNTEINRDIIISGTITEYQEGKGDYPVSIYSLDTRAPINTDSFKPSNQGLGVSPFTAPATLFAKDTRYIKKADITYDREKVKEIIENGHIKSVYLWDKTHREPVAKVDNAIFQQVAYASFEEEEIYNGTRSQNPCNWNIPLNGRSNIVFKTGEYGFDLSGKTVSTIEAIPIGKYLISYWSKSGAAAVEGGHSIISNNGTTPAMPDGWSFFVHEISLDLPAIVSIKGTNGNQFIDDLRLYPKDAKMTTYTYEPSAGMSSMTDEKGDIVYYDFDSFQRIKALKDHSRNIVKQYDYVYKPKITYYNTAISHTLRRNNCGSNAEGSLVTYTVPAKRYISIVSQDDANVKAEADISANAQTYANQNGTCTSCIGYDKKMINGVCVTASKTYTRSVWDGSRYKCFYTLRWGDGTEVYGSEMSNTPCVNVLAR